MEKLKLTTVLDDRPVKLTIELSATVFRDLSLYAEEMAKVGGQATAPEPAKLIAPMIERFMATDRVFSRLRRMQSLPHS